MVPRAQKPLLFSVRLTDKEAFLKRWAKHFDSVLNRPSSINDSINRLPQVECNLLLDEFPIVAETVKAIKLLSSGKAPGSDEVLVKMRQKESAKPSRNLHSAKPELRHH